MYFWLLSKSQKTCFRVYKNVLHLVKFWPFLLKTTVFKTVTDTFFWTLLENHQSKNSIFEAPAAPTFWIFGDYNSIGLMMLIGFCWNLCWIIWYIILRWCVKFYEIFMKFWMCWLYRRKYWKWKSNFNDKNFVNFTTILLLVK